jgi:hypothetical protein
MLPLFMYVSVDPEGKRFSLLVPLALVGWSASLSSATGVWLSLDLNMGTMCA